MQQSSTCCLLIKEMMTTEIINLISYNTKPYKGVSQTCTSYMLPSCYIFPLDEGLLAIVSRYSLIENKTDKR